ncbi:hypothetical protein L6R52_18075 [Myxococcota bacterium]|nr:hypothetical protein [Myxococcota bacterium]
MRLTREHGRARALSLALAGLALFVVGCGEPSVEPRTDGGTTSDGSTPESCERPRELCGTSCVNTATDPFNCGMCGMTCPASSFCSGGECARICSSGLMACGSSCIDPSSDRDHCGGCDAPCAQDRECRGGSCRCPEGYTDCNGACIDTDVDRNNCGICNRACDANQVCNDGSCDCAGGTRETDCTDGRDNDCDVFVDCADPDCEGATRSCQGACGPGAETCLATRIWGSCEGGNGDAEICGDGIDQDCDGDDLTNPDVWEPNDTCASCALIQGTDPNGFINARFDTVDDPIDCYKFVASDGSAYPEHIVVTLTGIPTGHDYDVYLYQGITNCESRTALGSSTELGNADESIDWSERFGSSDDGTYYVRVVRFSGYSCTQDYRLSINGLN